jgi:hypothetical protein
MILIADLPGNLVDRPRRKLKCLARLGYPHVLFGQPPIRDIKSLRSGKVVAITAA